MSSDSRSQQPKHDREAFGPSPVDLALLAIHQDLKGITDGEPSPSIPALANADPDHFGIVIATADGHVYETGDTRVPFSIQSISKAFTYGLALEDRGFEYVDSKIDVEPSGDAFNEISLDPVTHRPANPMINAGAITSTWMVADKDGTPRRERIRRLYSACADRELSIDDDVQRQESAEGHRNRALGWMLRSVDIIEEEPTQALEDYFAQCSVMLDARDLARMGATLAAGGLNPRTGERVLEPATVQRMLSVMNSCGMYDDAGEWFVRVGLPGKSGVGGGIIAVVPGQLAVATFSPPLDQHGNSVRGVAACERLSQALDLHFARGPRASRQTVRSINSLATSPSLMRRDQEAREYLANACRDIAILEIQGDLLFPGAEETVRAMRDVAETAESLILDLTAVDQVADFVPRMLANAANGIQQADCDVVVVGGENWQGSLGETPLFKTREKALVHVEDSVLAGSSADRQASDHDVLLHSDALRRMGEEAAERIWKRSTVVTVPKGEYLPPRYSRGGTVQWVLEGTAQIIANTKDADERPIRGLRPGTVVMDPREEEIPDAQEPAGPNGQAQAMNVRAATDLKLGVLSADALSELESEDPEAALALWKALAWVEAEDIVASLQEAVGWEPGNHWDDQS
ncbi:glutaminase A [Kocuria sp. JC486]|uniref:glutaminase A n=1 Tax=Kocuria sp. JC486 TaxID=1970736 RepID=UPI00141EE7EF|nr:glutaminase A [Kocuria sp. JC486]NHU85603.1 glutaminase A [Kocuria sp. JC486]